MEVSLGNSGHRKVCIQRLQNIQKNLDSIGRGDLSVSAIWICSSWLDFGGFE